MSLQFIKDTIAQQFVTCFKEEINEPNCTEYKTQINNIADLCNVADKIEAGTGMSLHVGRLKKMYTNLEQCKDINSAVNYLLNQYNDCARVSPSPTIYFQYSCVIADYLARGLEKIKANGQLTPEQCKTIEDGLTKSNQEKPENPYRFATMQKLSQDRVSLAPSSRFWAAKLGTSKLEAILAPTLDHQPANRMRK